MYGLYRSTSMQNFRLVASKMTELWIFKKFDLRGRGRGRGWGQNRGQIYLGILYLYYHTKSGGPSSKIDQVMAILKIRPPRSRSRLRSKMRSGVFIDCLGLLPCKISSF